MRLRTEIRLTYLRRVLQQRWPLPSSVPAMLVVGRDSNVVAARFMRLGFFVEQIGLQDASLQCLGARLRDRASGFDIVCCWDVLEHVAEWQAMVDMMARALRSGGVFFYSSSGRVEGSWNFVTRLCRQWLEDPVELIPPADLHAALRRGGLFPQRVAGLGYEDGRATTSRTVGEDLVSYMGYAFR
jgi:SAM-dependent methyltransferase